MEAGKRPSCEPRLVGKGQGRRLPRAGHARLRDREVIPSMFYVFAVVVLLFLFLVFRDRVSLCNSPACPGILSVNQTGLELTEMCLPLPPNVRQLKACATTARLVTTF